MNGAYGRLGTTKDGAASSTAAVGGGGGKGWAVLAELAKEYGDDVIDIIQSGRQQGGSVPDAPQVTSTPVGAGGGMPNVFKPPVLQQQQQQQAPGASPVAKMGAAGWVPWLAGGAVLLAAGYYLTRR